MSLAIVYCPIYRTSAVPSGVSRNLKLPKIEQTSWQLTATPSYIDGHAACLLPRLFPVPTCINFCFVAAVAVHMGKTPCVKSTQPLVTSSSRPCHLHLKLLGIAFEKLCTHMEMSVTSRFKSPAFVGGSQLAPSMQMCWRSILLAELTATYAGVVREGSRPANRGGQALGHAVRALFWAPGIPWLQSNCASASMLSFCFPLSGSLPSTMFPESV